MRFVILEHTGSPTYKPGVHWDLMFEQAVGLRTWEIPQPWDQSPQQVVRELPVHRAIYLEYEGPLTGERGVVRRIDRGEYQPKDDTADRWSVRLQGAVYRGTLTLERIDGLWRLDWRPAVE